MLTSSVNLSVDLVNIVEMYLRFAHNVVVLPGAEKRKHVLLFHPNARVKHDAMEFIFHAPAADYLSRISGDALDVRRLQHITAILQSLLIIFFERGGFEIFFGKTVDGKYPLFHHHFQRLLPLPLFIVECLGDGKFAGLFLVFLERVQQIFFPDCVAMSLLFADLTRNQTGS